MHYICTGECDGVSEKPGTCQAEDCSRHHQSLKPCDCSDGKHQNRQNKDEKKES